MFYEYNILNFMKIHTFDYQKIIMPYVLLLTHFCKNEMILLSVQNNTNLSFGLLDSIMQIIP